MATELRVVCQAVIAATFAWSVGGKARNRAALHSFRDTLAAVFPGLRPAQVGPIATAVVLAEATTAATVAVPPLAPLGFVLAALLLGGFTVVLASMLRRRLAAPCNCFGPTRRPVRATDLVRNVALLAVAVTGAASTVGDWDDVVDWTDVADWLGGGSPTAYLTVAVAALGAVGLLNLAATLRLGRQVGLLARAALLQPVSTLEDGPIRVAPGTPIGAFTAETVDGEAVSNVGLDGATLVGFIAPDCPACTDTLPDFVRRAATTPGGRRQVLAVVPGESATAHDLRQQLAEVALVVGDDGVEAMMDAFGVTSFPAYALLRRDTVMATHYLLKRLPETVPT